MKEESPRFSRIAAESNQGYIVVTFDGFGNGKHSDRLTVRKVTIPEVMSSKLPWEEEKSYKKRQKKTSGKIRIKKSKKIRGSKKHKQVTLIYKVELILKTLTRKKQSYDYGNININKGRTNQEEIKNQTVTNVVT